MNKEWFRLILPDGLAVVEAREWCEENCSGRFRVKQPKSKYDGTWTHLYRKASAMFQREDDAAAFKLRWL